MADSKATFMEVFSMLKSELLQDPALDWTTDLRQWVEQMIDHNVPHGKLNRGISVMHTYKLLKGEDEVTEDEIILTSILGWSIEWLLSSSLVHDDIMDNSYKRRGYPCWFRMPKVGMIAVNNGNLLRDLAYRILRSHFRTKPYYTELFDLFTEVEFQTISGQLADLLSAFEGREDLSKFTESFHRQIALYKSSYFSFYLSVASALLMLGERLENYVEAKGILLEMGVYGQVQDDYLDCYGDPETIGKIGTDIEEFKCSWLVGKAVELSNEEQKKIIYEHYGKSDPSGVAKVKTVYNELNIKGLYEDYEKKTYEEIKTSIEAISNKAMQAALNCFLGKIYKRQK